MVVEYRESWTLEKLQERYAALKERLDGMQVAQEQYTPLIELSRNLSAVYRIDSFAKTYKQKNVALSRKIDSTNGLLGEVKTLLG
jgi:hypothetical protein